MIKKDNRLTLIIGCCGAGKTTYLRHYSDRLHFDAERHLDALLDGRRKYYPEVWRVARRMLHAGYEAALATGLDIALTASGHTRTERATWLLPARLHGYHTEIVLVRVSPETALVRCKADAARPKTTRWRPIIEHWFRDFEAVEADECDEYRIVENENRVAAREHGDV